MQTTVLVRVKVTQDNIDKGRRELCDLCPIALALKDDGYTVDVYNTEVWFTDDNYQMTGIASLPWEARQFVSFFDNGHPVAPFEFDLDVPEAATR